MTIIAVLLLGCVITEDCVVYSSCILMLTVGLNAVLTWGIDTIFVCMYEVLHIVNASMVDYSLCFCLFF